MKTWGFSHIGRVRQTNEDSFWIWQEGEKGCFVVADGMGGHQAGDVASNLAIQHLSQFLEGELATSCDISAAKGVALLQEGIKKSNQKVFQSAENRRDLAGMGTTITAALVLGDQLVSAHVGDSRLYLFREGRLELLTRDHSLVQELVEEGVVQPAEAETHPRRHILTRAIGTDAHVEVDTRTFSLLPRDLILLCTDGLTNSVTAGEIEETLAQGESLAGQGQALVTLANAKGGEDNVTIILAQIEPVSVGN